MTPQRSKKEDSPFIVGFAKKDSHQSTIMVVSIYFAKILMQIPLACVPGSTKATILPTGLGQTDWKISHLSLNMI